MMLEDSTSSTNASSQACSSRTAYAETSPSTQSSTVHPNPPLHLQIDGTELFDVRTDMETWTSHPEENAKRQTPPRHNNRQNRLRSTPQSKSRNQAKSTFLKKTEKTSKKWNRRKPTFRPWRPRGFAKKSRNLRTALRRKNQPWKNPYLAASCITVLNYLLDTQD